MVGSKPHASHRARRSRDSLGLSDIRRCLSGRDIGHQQPCPSSPSRPVFRHERVSQGPFVGNFVKISTCLGMYTQVLPTGQTEAIKSSLLYPLFFCFSDGQPVVHETLQLSKCLLNLRDRSRAVNELPSGRIELMLVGQSSSDAQACLAHLLI